jgi:Right handed beta helix region
LEHLLKRISRLALLVALAVPGQFANAQSTATHFFVDCSQPATGDGTQAHPWNTLDALSNHLFRPGEVAAIRRGTRCNGTLALHGSGSPQAIARLTAYGEGARPQIAAGNAPIQAVLLKNAEYWQIDSLDISGGNTYGLLVTGDRDAVQSHITLRNLVVHGVRGGALKNKDNGLVVFLRGSGGQRFDHILIDNVVAAHTNQWAGIMMGAGPFYSAEENYNRDVVIRNSVVHDVYGDGIILFRVSNGIIESSTAWLTGQQPTQDVGTPNAIWTWSCTQCTVRDNEAFLTDSPGVDGGAYDIDWATTSNTVQDNYAHDTQGYCVAVFAAGYVTQDASVRGNVCVNNGLSPRLAALQGAIYIHTWNGGTIDRMSIEKNLIDWNPPVPAAPIVNGEDTQFAGSPLLVEGNIIQSTSPALMQSSGKQLTFSSNRYEYAGTEQPYWNWNGTHWTSWSRLQAAGVEEGGTLAIEPSASGQPPASTSPSPSLSLHELMALTPLQGPPLHTKAGPQAWIVTSLPLKLDTYGLFEPGTMAHLSVLRTLAREYSSRQLQIFVLVPHLRVDRALRNALLDLDTPAIHFVHNPEPARQIPTEIISAPGKVFASWSDPSTNLNAAVLGYAVRRLLGTPVYAQMDTRP